jgi:predicted glycogen debranching enzyme
LVTNGLGGYASGTVGGCLTRRYHGLLIAALKPPLARTLMLTKLDESVTYAGRDYALFANLWVGETMEPEGFRHLERFHLEGTIPVWTYACADALLEKRIWMEPGANTTYVQYHYRRGQAPLDISLKALVNYRDHHELQRALGRWMRVEPVGGGVRVVAHDDAVPYYLLSATANLETCHEWHRDFYLQMEARRGLDMVEDHLCAGVFQATLEPGENLTLVASTSATPSLDGEAAYKVRQSYERALLKRAGSITTTPPMEQLVLAADQFIVRRELPESPEGRSVIAGYPWFADWGRDTMIALPGLSLTTGRYDVARQILRVFARYVDQGMLPNNFPEVGEQPGYNTVDATLWYFQALRAYHAATKDTDLLREIFPILEEIIHWHERGTRYQIHVDPEDGLLYAGEPGSQLTWMDVKVEDWVVTPRTGKAVEINALWYNTLRTLADFAEILGKPATEFLKAAERVRAGFARFWNAEVGYCYDVLDTPDGDDATLRPNQLFVVSLPYSPLSPEQQKAVVDVCAQTLLTSHGLRSLSPDAPDYEGSYGGNRKERDGAYHQGTAWGWLMGPFVLAHLKVYDDPETARTYLRPLLQQLRSHGIGTLSEIFDGDPPFTPRGCIAQAWTVAEVLRAWQEIEKRLD